MKDSFDKFFSFHCAAPSYIFHQHPAWFSLLNSRQIAATNLLRQSFRLSFPIRENYTYIHGYTAELAVSPWSTFFLLSLYTLVIYRGLEISGVNYTLLNILKVLNSTDRFVNDENEPLFERINTFRCKSKYIDDRFLSLVDYNIKFH
jgi:hypothetical protein